MDNVFPKYIIEDGCIILGKVTYHLELVWDKKDLSKVKGGGWFRWEDRMIVFYEKSTDFGKASLEDVKACVEAKQIFTDKFKINEFPEEFEIGYDTGTEIIKIR